MGDVGLLKKRLWSLYSDEEWKEIDIEDPRLSHIVFETFDEIVDEAKKDIYEPIKKLEVVDEPNGMDYAYTYQKIIERLKKWFGESE